MTTVTQWAVRHVEVNRGIDGQVGHNVSMIATDGATAEVTVWWDAASCVTPVADGDYPAVLGRRFADGRHWVEGKDAVSRAMEYAEEQWGDALGATHGGYASIVVELVYLNPVIYVWPSNDGQTAWVTQDIGANVHNSLGPESFREAMQDLSDRGRLSGLYGRAEHHATRWVRRNIPSMVEQKLA